MPAAGRNPLLLRPLVLFVLAVAVVSDAQAFAGWISDLGDIDSKQRLWLAAFGGLALGAAFGMLALELRARSTSVSLRRLTDLAAGVDGRMPEATQRQSVSTEFARLSDEILYTTQRVARDRREAAAKLAAWEAMFAAALDAILALDADGVIVHINPAAERLFRIRADDVIGQSFVDIVLPPAHRSPDNACFARELAAGKAQGRRQELVAQRGDGRQFPVEVAIGQLTEGHRIALIVTAHDISMQRRARAELARIREQTRPAEAHVGKQPVAAPVAETAVGHKPAAGGKPAAPSRSPAAAARSAFTIDETCGELVRKLAARAERRGLGFRYEDGEVQGLALVGDSSRLRRALINLIDSVVRVADSGEVVVHVVAVPAEARQVDVTVALSATRLSDAQVARMIKPFATDGASRRDERSSSGRGSAERSIDFFGTRVVWVRTPGGGATFRFGQRFDIDLTRVSIDLSAPAAESSSPKPATKARTAAASSAEAQRAKVEFTRAATRLRKNADAGNLIALWAEAHRLKGMWQRHGDPANAGLVTALAYTARGGDAENSLTLARRFADALEAKSGRDRPATLHDATVAA